MAGLRDIKRRIKSIESTKKITQAMKMVAMAKVKRAENAVKSSTPYFENIDRMLQKILSKGIEKNNKNQEFNRPQYNYPKLLEEREIKIVGILVVSSDKGLAGSYNVNVSKKAEKRIKELQKENIDVKLFIVGSKAISALKKHSNLFEKTYTKLPAIPTVGTAHIILEDVAEAFVEDKIDQFEVITTHFKSIMSNEVQNQTILPIEKKEEETGEMEFEPSTDEILKQVAPLYLSSKIYQALIEAAASELSSRMMAMSMATTNSESIINRLKIEYNKIRQASITQELLEVISGSEALRK